MSASVSSVEIFRRKLERAVDISSEKEGHQLETAILRGLLIDFDLLFPQEVYQAYGPENISNYVELYCEQDPEKCPICSSKLAIRTVRKTKEKFLGCSKYPDCKGTRNKDGTISLTSAIRAHIAKRLYETAQKRETNPLQRFSELECE